MDPMMKGREFRKASLTALILAVMSLVLTSCATVYYRTMETFGQHKRDILVDRVKDARDSQEQAGEQFRSALDRFSEVVHFEGGELAAMYGRLKTEYERSESKANEVSDRIAAVEKVAEDLFDEWERELDQYSSEQLRRSSEETLRATRARYGQLIGAMQRAESRMPPVLVLLKDQVLYLKHRLNARAIASLEDKAVELQGEVDALLQELENSIAEANAFIEELL
jgi:hypothetical protein